MRPFSMLAALIGVLLLSPGAASADQACPWPNRVRILPAGDSITFGALPVGDWRLMGGYRYPLSVSLAGAGYQVDFVGPFANGPSGWGDSQHGGGVGYKTSDLLAVMRQWVAGYRPRVVLLMIGTNDLQPGDVSTTVARASQVGQLLDLIHDADPCIDTIVSDIPTPTTDGWPDAAHAWNDAQDVQVATKAQAGYRVHPQSLDAPVSISSDTVHPDDEGYLAVAGRFRASLGTILPPPAAPSAPEITLPEGTVTVAWPVLSWRRPPGYVDQYAVYDYPTTQVEPLWWATDDPDSVCSGDTCALAAPWPLPAGHHFLFVIYRTGSVWGPWSAPREFCVVTC
jgi:lysophospholipase L1-like esterase